MLEPHVKFQTGSKCQTPRLSHAVTCISHHCFHDIPLFDGNSVGFHGQNYNSDPFQGLGMPLCDKAGIISNMPLASLKYFGGGELYILRTQWSFPQGGTQLFSAIPMFHRFAL